MHPNFDEKWWPLFSCKAQWSAGKAPHHHGDHVTLLWPGWTRSSHHPSRPVKMKAGAWSTDRAENLCSLSWRVACLACWYFLSIQVHEPLFSMAAVHSRDHGVGWGGDRLRSCFYPTEGFLPTICGRLSSISTAASAYCPRMFFWDI